MIFRFKKGTHRARPLYWLRWWPFRWNPKRITREVVFRSDSKYWLLSRDQDDHNKLFGLGFINPKKYSARFGWRYNPDTGRFIISAFVHDKGEMLFEDLGQVGPNDRCFCVLEVHPNYYRFELHTPYNGCRRSTVYKTHTRKVAFLLGPYFGGNRPAPDDLKISLK